MYIILRLFDVSSYLSLAFSILLSFDNAFIVEFRHVLVDSFLTFFSMMTILFCAIFNRRPNKIYLLAILAGIFAGCTVSIKLTGCGAALTLIITYFINYPISQSIILSFISGISGFAVFLGSFILHFSLLKKPGPGCPFHPPSFCKGLIYKEKMDLFTNIFQLLYTMLDRNFAIDASHHYSSKWYQWPVMQGKGTYLWVEGKSSLWCVGNPCVWFLGLIGIFIYSISLFFSSKIRYTIWLLFGYCISYFPFARIHRVLYNYHYFLPLILTLIQCAISLNEFTSKSKYFSIPIIILGGIGYVLYYPITYGTPIEPQNFHRIMFGSWIYH